MSSRTALLLLLAAGSVVSYAQDKNASEYAQLLARVKAGDAVVDYKQMRLAYMESPEYKAAKNTDAEIGAMIEAINGNDFPAAIRNAEVVLANDYVDLDAHFAEYIAHRELHHDAEAKLHKDIFDGLLQSITASGDGKSAATAFVVISSHEEYVLMRVAGLVPGKQTLKKVNHHSFDIFEVTDEKSSQPVVLYFNIDIPIKHGE
jgi:hypothetical protein